MSDSTPITPRHHSRVGTWVIVAAVLLAAAGMTTALIRSASSTPGVPTPTPWAVYGGSTRVYGGNTYDAFSSTAALPDGGLIAVGSTASTDGDFPMTHGGPLDAVVMKLAPNGSITWAETLGGTGEEALMSVAVAVDGTIIAVGYTNSTDGDFPMMHKGDANAVVVKLAPDGAIIWAHTLGGSGSDVFTSVAIDQDGNIVAAGSTDSTDGDFPVPNEGNTAALVAKLTPDGTLAWAKTFGGPGVLGAKTAAYSQFVSVDIASDNTIVAGGDTDPTGGDLPATHGGADMVVVKLSTDGTVAWAQSYGSSGNDTMGALAVCPDDSLVIVGTPALGDGDFPADHSADVGVAKLTPDGAVEWTKTVGGSGGDFPSAIALGEDGRIVVAGETFSVDGIFARMGGGTAAFVAEFLPTGDLDWAKTYISSVGSSLGGVVDEPDGTIVAVGFTGSPDGDFTGARGHAIVARLTADGTLS